MVIIKHIYKIILCLFIGCTTLGTGADKAPGQSGVLNPGIPYKLDIQDGELYLNSPAGTPAVGLQQGLVRDTVESFVGPKSEGPYPLTLDFFNQITETTDEGITQLKRNITISDSLKEDLTQIRAKIDMEHTSSPTPLLLLLILKLSIQAIIAHCTNHSVLFCICRPSPEGDIMALMLTHHPADKSPIIVAIAYDSSGTVSAVKTLFNNSEFTPSTDPEKNQNWWNDLRRLLGECFGDRKAQAQESLFQDFSQLAPVPAEYRQQNLKNLIRYISADHPQCYIPRRRPFTFLDAEYAVMRPNPIDEALSTEHVDRVYT